MSMNQTPMSERVHIGFFGKRNAGKSSVMNAVTGQDLAVVSSERNNDGSRLQIYGAAAPRTGRYDGHARN